VIASLPYERVVSEWRLAREQVIAALNDLPPDKFEVEMLFPWGYRGTVRQLIMMFVEHEEEHAAEITALKSKLAAPPDQPPSIETRPAEAHRRGSGCLYKPGSFSPSHSPQTVECQFFSRKYRPTNRVEM